MLDSIGVAHMQQGNLTKFDVDRCGNSNSALNLNGGYTQVPSGVYFNTSEFTVSVWVYPLNMSGASVKIIDFGNGQSLDIIYFSFQSSSNLKPGLQIYVGTNQKISIWSSSILIMSQWQLLTFTFNITSVSLYMNAVLMISLSSNFTLSSVTRSKNYIGKGNWATDGFSWSLLDDLRFYNKSLSLSEIKDLMNSNCTTTTSSFMTSKLFNQVKKLNIY